MLGISAGDHVRQDSMDFSKEWEDSANCRCGDRLKPLERRAARQHQRCLAHSLVGTPNYIAPEVLLRTGELVPDPRKGIGFCIYVHSDGWKQFVFPVVVLLADGVLFCSCIVQC